MSAPAASYSSELASAMRMLADDPRVVFVGQGVRYNSHRMFGSLEGIPMERRIEMPVAEDFQMGFCTGLALEGMVPVALYPRWDFLLLAANQLVNHLDKLYRFGWHPKVIIRVAVGATAPMNPGPQHTQDHTRAFRKMLQSVKAHRLTAAESVFPAYRHALNSRHSSIMVEYMEHY